MEGSIVSNTSSISQKPGLTKYDSYSSITVNPDISDFKWKMSRYLLGRRPKGYIHKQTKCRLLNQPLDVLRLIFDWLEPESVLLTALTCKEAYFAFFKATKKHLASEGLQNLLVTLEKPLSRTHYFCAECKKLHLYSSPWVLGCGIKSYLEPPCRPDITGDPHFGFHHARLTMNKHFFGSGRGLNLERLTTHSKPTSIGWQVHSEARIIQDELFLCVTHTFEARQSPRVNQLAFEKHKLYFFCQHVSSRRIQNVVWGQARVAFQALPELAATQRKGPHAFLADCYRSPQSCADCLADFATTIERKPFKRNGQEKEHLVVTVAVYHQLGDCRTPTDWKWDLFANRYNAYRDGQLSRARCFANVHGLGAVKSRWEMDVLASKQEDKGYLTKVANLVKRVGRPVSQ